MSKKKIQNLKDALYSSRVIDTYCQYCRSKYPHVDIKSILRAAGIEEYEVADQGHWFSDQQVDRFYELMVAATGNENLAREAGRYAAAPGTLGVMRQYTLGLIGPTKAFQVLESSAKNFTRSAIYESKKIGTNRVEVTVAQVQGIREKEYACANRIGFFEAIVTAFGLPIPRIEHETCIFKGSEVCRYIITWEKNSAAFFKQARDWSGALLTGAVMTSLFLAPTSLVWLFPVSVIIILSLSIAHERLLNRQMQNSIDSLWSSADDLTEQISINYRNTQLAQDVGSIISAKTTIDDVLSSLIKVLQDRLDFDRGLVLLANETRTRLDIRGAFGYSDDQIDLLETTSFRLDNPTSRGVFTHAFHHKQPYLINDVEQIEEDLTEKSLNFIRALSIHSFIACPIILDGEPIGILGVDNFTSKKPLLRSDMNMIMGVAPAMGVAIQNAQLIEEQQAQFESTLKILADSIDARDFLTAGHSEQVAEYATGIAKEMSLSQEFIQMIRIASLLHDYGKIAVPDSILKKDGRLTEEEMAIIRTHPVKTQEILSRVPFKGIYAEIPEICAAHHEKLDGSGYPRGLRNDQIPLGAKIIAVADFYEAITSKRHYRDPMPVEKAIEMLLSESGEHFDQQLVKALLRYLNKTAVCLIDATEIDPDLVFRGNARVKYRTQVSAEIGRKIVAGTSVDISTGGIFVRATEPDQLKKGQDIILTFSLPSPERLVRIFGRIAWVNAGEPLLSEKYPHGFGAEFRAMPAETKKYLREYAEKAYRTDHRNIIIPENGDSIN